MFSEVVLINNVLGNLDEFDTDILWAFGRSFEVKIGVVKAGKPRAWAR